MFEVTHYYLQMYLRILETNALKYMSLTLQLELLTDVNMLLVTEKGIRGGICNAVHR